MCHAWRGNEPSNDAVEKIKAMEAEAAEERLDAYFGDRFSEVQKALASRPQEPDVPSF